MKKEERIPVALIGGDLRQAYLAKELEERGFQAKAFALEEQDLFLSEKGLLGLKEYGLVLLPLPVTRDQTYLFTPLSGQKIRLEELWPLLSPCALVMGGRMDNQLKEACKRLSLEPIDYFTREELAVYNTVSTAEGALAIAMKERDKTIFGSACFITGFGRVAKTLCRLVSACGAKTTVIARRQEDLAWAHIQGYQAITFEELAYNAPAADILFNTVPAPVIDEPVLQRLAKNCLIIDLASAPGGLDFSLTQQKGIRAVQALSLPGKVAPCSAARAICDTILNILRERGIFVE